MAEWVRNHRKKLEIYLAVRNCIESNISETHRHASLFGLNELVKCLVAPFVILYRDQADLN
jgi:hypothetical protein